MGSKARIAKDISPIINQIIKDNGITLYIEPFVGGANMIQHIQCEKRHGYDNNKYLIAFWTRIQQGWNPLTEVEMSREYYNFVREDPDHFEPEYVALCGFCATYNAKWFGGYAGTVKTKIDTYRNYYDEAVRNVLKQKRHLQGVQFTCSDYRELKVKGALIYCDPPYQGTTGYKDSFDHESYWEWVREMSKTNIVLCSEYSAPPDFECIWAKELTTTLDKNSRSKAVEKLFVPMKGCARKMFYSDDPVRDFEQHDREQAKRLEKMPECADCGDPVQDDHYYLINDEVICPDCLESNYRKEIDEVFF